MRLMTVMVCVVSAMLIGFAGCTGGDAQGEPGAEVTKEQFETWMTELSNWGRWGEDDQLGALNLITPEKRIEASALVRTGQLVSMARSMEIDRLENPEEASANRPPVLLGSVRNVFGINTEAGFFWERYEIEYHGSEVSHIDALCHVAYEGKVYNGRDFETVASTEDGCVEMGILNVEDGIVTRGVLLDMPGQVVRRRDIEQWEQETGITISSGDALFLRTGRDIGETGGYHPSLIPFFKERDISLLGADVPQEGGEVEGVTIPIHVFTLVALGVHLFDNMGLEDIAQKAQELNHWEFLFMASPHVVPNGAGSAINPLAVF